MGFFRRHQGRASYDLFSNYSHYLPGFGGMLGLFALFFLGSLLGSLVSGLFVMLMGPSEEKICIVYSQIFTSSAMSTFV